MNEWALTPGLITIAIGIGIFVMVNNHYNNLSEKRFDKNYSHCPHCGSTQLEYYRWLFNEERNVNEHDDKPSTSYYSYSYKAYTRCAGCGKQGEEQKFSTTSRYSGQMDEHIQISEAEFRKHTKESVKDDGGCLDSMGRIFSYITATIITLTGIGFVLYSFIS